MSRPSKYPEQFRKDAVALVRSSDRPLRHVARELGVIHETLRSWVKATEDASATPSSWSSAADQDELRTPAQAGGGTGAGEGHSPQSSRLLREGDGSLTRGYRFISEHRATRLCRVLDVRRPGFYEWLAAAPAREVRAIEDEELANEIAWSRRAPWRLRLSACHGRVASPRPVGQPQTCAADHARARDCRAHPASAPVADHTTDARSPVCTPRSSHRGDQAQHTT